MPLCSKFLTECTGKEIVKINQYLARYGQRTIAYFLQPPCRMISLCHTLSLRVASLPICAVVVLLSSRDQLFTQRDDACVSKNRLQ